MGGGAPAVDLPQDAVVGVLDPQLDPRAAVPPQPPDLLTRRVLADKKTAASQGKAGFLGL